MAAGGINRDTGVHANVGELRAIYIVPTFWRRGAGQTLWNRSLPYFRLREYSVVTLWVLEQNITARRFYEALGFSLDMTANRTVEIGGQNLVELHYVASISPTNGAF